MRGGRRRRRRRGVNTQAWDGGQDRDIGRRGREVNTKAWEHNSVSHPDVTKGNFTSTKAHSSSSETPAASVNQSLGIEAGACVKVIATSRRTR